MRRRIMGTDMGRRGAEGHLKVSLQKFSKERMEVELVGILTKGAEYAICETAPNTRW